MTHPHPMDVGSQVLEVPAALASNANRVSYSSYMALRRVQSDRRRCTLGQKRKMAPLRDSVSRDEPSNNAMQLTGRPGTHLAVSAPPHISSKGGAQGARPSRPAADRGRCADGT